MSQSSQSQDEKEVTAAPGPDNFKAGLAVWSTLVDMYMKYVTLWFTAAGITLTIFSFGIKSIIIDTTTQVTKIAVATFLNLACFIGLFCAIAVRRRAYLFSDAIHEVESALMQFPQLRPYFRHLPGTAIMKTLIRVGILGIAITQAALLILWGILWFRAAPFPGQ